MASIQGIPQRGARLALDPTPLLFLIATSGALVWALAESPLAAVAIVAAAASPALIYAISRSDTAAVVSLGLGMVIARYALKIGGSHVYPEHIATALLLGAVALRWVRGERLHMRERWLALDFVLLLYIALNFVSSVFFSSAPMQTARWALLQTLGILPYFLVRVLAGRGVDDFRRVVRLLLLVFALEALVGLGCFLSNRAFHTGFGMDVEQYGIGDVPGTYGTQREANLLASTSAAAFLVLLTMYLYRPEKWLLAGCAATWTPILISLSRAATGGVLLVIPVLLLVMYRKKWIARGALRRIFLAVGCLSLALAPLVVPLWSARFGEQGRLATGTVIDDPNTQLRLLTFDAALEGIFERPIMGNGTASFQLIFDWEMVGIDPKDVDEQSGWIGNTELRVLYDTGIVGFTVFATFLIGLAVACWKTLKRHRSPELLGLMAASLVYCITFQFTEATMLAFCWVHIGLLAAGVVVLRKSGDPERTSTAV
jgi:O-antigen ligase